MLIYWGFSTVRQEFRMMVSFNKHSASGPGFTSRPNLYATGVLIILKIELEIGVPCAPSSSRLTSH